MTTSEKTMTTTTTTTDSAASATTLELTAPPPQTTPPEQTAPPEPTVDKGRIRWIFAGLLLAMLLSSLDQTVFSTTLPTIVGELNGVDHMLWVTTAYILASTIVMPVYGKLGDLVGRKNLFIGALVLFMAGSLIGGMASSMGVLIAGRAIQGLGGGGLMILAQAIIADVVPPRDRGRYMGVMGGVFGVSTVIGPLLGGWFADTIGWRWALWMNLPLGLLAIVAAVVFLRLPRKKTQITMDWAGMATMAVSVTSIILVTSWGGSQYDWTSPVILGLIALAIIAAAAFVAIERRAAEPIIPLHLFRQRNFNLTTIGGLLLAVAMFGAVSYLPTYLQMVGGVNATESGYLMVPMVGGMLITSISAGQIASRTGRYRWMPIASALVTATGLGLLSQLTATTSLVVFCLNVFVLGAGLGLGTQILVLIVQNTFSNKEVGTATAANNFFREIGASIGAAVVGSLFSTRLASQLAERLTSTAGGASIDPSGITPAQVRELPAELQDVVVTSYADSLAPIFGYLVPLMVIAAVILWFVREEPLRSTV